MPATYEPIATTTLSSTQTTVTFSSISSAYTDLRVVCVAKDTAGGTAQIRFNNDTGANYSYTFIYGTGSSATSALATGTTFIAVSQANATELCMWAVDIFSYAGSTRKTCLSFSASDQNGSGRTSQYVGLWRSTSAINRIDIITNGSGFASGGTFTLYGILKA